MSPSALEQTAALRTASIIEDVVPSSLASSLKGPLVVHYPEHTVSKGEAIPRAGTLAQPELEFKEADTDATYTLFMVDPDLLKRNDTFSGQVRHWFETGVKFEGTSGRVVISSQAGARNDYVPPSPAYGTGKHRYVFLAAREPSSYAGPQNKDFPLTGKADLKDRMKFSVAQYIQEEGLTLEAAGWMEVDADAAAMKDNLMLSGEAIINKLTGK
ncbi:phosphatidylethanolamine-binding protein [Rhodotorula diobovata]|uniref:Phosphatidylethanolamine-binding protein n=1 Tax=Rhodotorula diobovata TaxID=5288 RepID=A0A5C5FYI9_9BASI|nr:phosphatidylethanolamine-binding protein [Rhodotorula diobovata]